MLTMGMPRTAASYDVNMCVRQQAVKPTCGRTDISDERPPIAQVSFAERSCPEFLDSVQQSRTVDGASQLLSDLL